MKKALLPVFLFLASSPAWATCPTKVNPSKVMLFIDTNYSDLEIATAQKAACKRGERLEIVPKNYREYAPFIKSYESSSQTMMNCRKAARISEVDQEVKCKQEVKAYNYASEGLEAFKAKQVPVDKQIEAKLAVLNKEKVKLTNLSISGHNGGGSFGGSKGSFGRVELLSMISKYPEMNQVESLLLLGCYTGVQKEVAAWKAMFPKVRIIAGFDGSAPLSSRPYGHTYIEDILTKEKSLIKINEAAKVDGEVKKLVTDLEKINAAIYLHPSCSSDNNEFYYAAKQDHKFARLNLSACDNALAEMSLLRPLFLKYAAGELEPPKDTAQGDLRKMYDKVRASEHCLRAGNNDMNEVNVNGVFNLLFWDGVKKNYADFYQDDMAEVAKIVATIKPDEVIENLQKMITGLIESQKSSETELAAFRSDPAAFTKSKEDELTQLKAEHKSLENSEKYKNLSARWRQGNYDEFTPEEKKLFQKQVEDKMVLSSKDSLLNFLKTDPKYFEERIVSGISYEKDQVTRDELKIQEIRTTPLLLKKFFLPNRENLEKKSRKEILANIHNIDGILGLSGLNPKQQGALNFIRNSSNSHLVNLENPFSWHEAVGRPEKPQYDNRLSNYLEETK